MRRAAASIAVLLSAFAASDALASALDLGAERPVRRRWERSRAAGTAGLKDLTIARVHLGLSAPIGNFGDRFGSGLGFGGSIGYGVGENAVVSGSVAYHRFDHERDPNREASVTPITINADFALPTGGRAVPWIGFGTGVYRVAEHVDVGSTTVSISENNFGLNFGVGFGAPISERSLFGAGMKFHYVAGDDLIDTPFLTFQMGFGFVL